MSSNPKKVILILAGLPGSGKTALADWLAEREDCIVISRDSIKRALFGRHDVGVRQNLVAFNVMQKAIPVSVDLAPLVILDGMTFSREGQVEQIVQIGAELGVTCIPLLMDCPVEVAQNRLSEPDPSGPYDRDAALVARVARNFRPIPDSWSRVNANQALEAVQFDVQKVLRSKGAVS